MAGMVPPAAHLDQLQAQQFRAFEAIVASSSSSSSSSSSTSSSSQAPSLSVSTSAASARAASVRSAAPVAVQPVSLDWKNQRTVANLRSILASIDTPIEEVPFGSPIASPVNVPSATAPAPSLPPKKSSKAAMLSTPTSSSEAVRRSKSPPPRTSPAKLDLSSSSSSESSSVAAPAAAESDQPPPPLPKKSKKPATTTASRSSAREPSSAASASAGEAGETASAVFDKIKRTPSRRAYDDLFGGDDAASAPPAMPAKSGLAARLKNQSARPASQQQQQQQQQDLMSADAATPAPTAAPPTLARPPVTTSFNAGNASPAAQLVQSMRASRHASTQGSVPSDVAEAKRALLQLKAGLALRENSLLSLAGAQAASGGGGALPPVTGVMRPVRKPKTRDEAAVKIQSWWRMVVQRRRYKREWQRLRIAREMSASEQTYIEMIEKAFALFWEPMQASARSGKPMASQDDVDVIFSRLGDIMPLNYYLSTLLAERVQHWTPDKCIGDVFLDFARFNDSAFRQTYEDYTVHYYVAIERVQSCCANPRFRQWLDETQQGGASLQSYLILPIQRLARYVLLLRQMRKFTLEPHPDCAALDDATALMTVVVNAINEAERSADIDRTAARQLRELNEQLEPRIADLEQAGRRWIARGELAHLTVIDMAVHRRHYELLNDSILLTKQRGRSRLTLKLRASLVGARCRALAAGDMAALGSADPSLNFCVELNTLSQGFILAFATDAERKQFLASFEKCDTKPRKPPAAIVPRAVMPRNAPLATKPTSQAPKPSAPAPSAPGAAAAAAAAPSPAASAVPAMSPPPKLTPPPELMMSKPPALVAPPSLSNSSESLSSSSFRD
jgi:hypothetical protein